jgi:rhodanese-related sulfurtransferase
VLALENGTQGWFLAGLELEHGASRAYPDAPSGKDLDSLKLRAEAHASRAGVPSVASSEAERWLADQSRTTYLFDVRTAEEFAAGSIAGAAHAPGGQLVQATDQWVGVRGARIVLADSDGVRAPMVAAWLRQMGHEASVLREGTGATLRVADPSSIARLPEIIDANPADANGALVVDLRSSAAYRKGHLRGSVWGIRPRLSGLLKARPSKVVLVAEDRALAQAAALDIAEEGVKDIRFLAASRIGADLEASPGSPADAERIDFLFFTARRHEGDRAAAEQYLAWETALVDQLDAEERATFHL